MRSSSSIMMRFRALASMIGTSNDYSLLKWPLLILSISITFLAFILLLALQTKSWFTYESFEITTRSISPNQTTTDIRSLEYGSFGLWRVCIGNDFDQSTICDTWTRRTRPEFFDVTLVLLSCALFLANLTIFPSWAATILVIYNTENRYIRYAVVFLWILLSLSILLLALLICVMMLIGVTKYYSPGKFFIDTKHIFFHTGPGIVFIFTGTILAIVCLLLTITALIWKKFIDMRLIDEEKRLYQYLTDDNSSSNWHEVIRFPRNISIPDDNFEQPPPYHSSR